MYITMIRRTKIEIKSGNILKENDIDAICVPMNADGKMAGGVSLAVRTYGGISIEKELKSKKPLHLGRAVSTSAGKLPYKRVIHGIIMPHVASKSTTEDVIYTTVQSALGVCDSNGLHSIAFTSFATGFGGWPFQKSANVMLRATVDYINRGTKIKKIRFVAYEKTFGDSYNSFLKALFKNLKFDLKPVILVVDMINDFFGPGKIIYGNKAKNLCNNINELLSVARKCQVPIIFLNDSHKSPNDWEFTRTPIHALKGSQGAQVVEEISYQKEKIVEKSRYDGFYKTELEATLKGLKANTVILCGIQTHVCVLLTAISAFYRGFRPIIVKDCTASSTADKHNFGIWYLETYGADIGDMQDIIYMLQNIKKVEK